MLLLCRRQARTEPGFIAAVGIDRSGPVFYYNPEWSEDPARTDAEFGAVFRHEVAHLVHGDIPRSLRRIALLPKEEKHRVMRMYNLAMDAANNDLLAMDDKLKLRSHEFAQTWVYSDSAMFRGAKGQQDWAYYFSLINAWLEADKHDKGEEAEAGDGDNGDGDNGDGQEGGDQAGGGGGSTKGKKGGKGKKGKKGDEGTQGSSLQDHLAATDRTHMWMEAAEGMLADAAITGDDIGPYLDGMEEKTKNVLRTAMREQARAHGSLPAHFKSALDGLIQEDSVVPWQRVFEQVMASAIATSRQSTPSLPQRRNRIDFYIGTDGKICRLPRPVPLFPGRTRQVGYNVLVTLDTSGSMSDNCLIEVLGTIKNMINHIPGAAISAIQVDTHISNTHVFQTDESVEDYIADVGRTSAGGTHFDAPFDLQTALITNEADNDVIKASLATLSSGGVSVPFDLIVYCTDGYGYVTAPPPDVPVVWVLTKTGADKPSFQEQPFGYFVKMT